MIRVRKLHMSGLAVVASTLILFLTTSALRVVADGTATDELTIEVREVSGIARAGSPVAYHLELPRAVPRATPFALFDEKGEPVIAQFSPAADGPMSAAWWLDFNAELKPWETRRYIVRFGEAFAPAMRQRAAINSRKRTGSTKSRMPLTSHGLSRAIWLVCSVRSIFRPTSTCFRTPAGWCCATVRGVNTFWEQASMPAESFAMDGGLSLCGSRVRHAIRPWPESVRASI